MELEDALPGLSAVAARSLEGCNISDRLRTALSRHRARTAVDVARLSLDEIGLFPNVGKETQLEAAVAAINALSRGALKAGSEAAGDAVRRSRRDTAAERRKASRNCSQ